MSVDIMLDLETTGVDPGCCVLSIGAISFDINAHSFEVDIDHQSCKDVGLVDDPDTMKWWSRQDPAAYERAFSGSTPIIKALGSFTDWFTKLGKGESAFIWGNGADFDIPILKAAYDACGMKAPWKPYNGRCYRTLKNLYKDVKAPPFDGIKHTALADARFQALHARLILRTHFARVQD
jgi:hypothetical protein